MFLRELPSFIKGKNLLICGFIRDGVDGYDQIAKLMGLTESGVRNRVSKMKKRIEAMKLAGQIGKRNP